MPDPHATPDRAATAEELPSGGWIVNYGQPWNYRVFATKERADAFCEGYNAALEARDG